MKHTQFAQFGNLSVFEITSCFQNVLSVYRPGMDYFNILYIFYLLHAFDSLKIGSKKVTKPNLLEIWFAS